MDVRCEKCGSEYELDDNKVTTQGVSVKCTTCNNVFRVTKAAAPTRSPTTGDWMIKQANGQVFKFKELTTLQRWIVERRVNRDDEISKTGDTWKKLGDIFELASFFQVAEHAGGPASAPLHKQQISTVDDPDSPRARSGSSLIIAVSMIALGLIGGVFVARKNIADWIRGPEKPVVNPTQELADGHVRSAMKEMRKDTFPAFAAADQELEKALALNANHPAALAGATIVLTAWAEYAREEAQDIDAQIKAAGAGKIKMAPAELAQQAGELAKKQADASARTERAFAYMKRALEADPGGENGLKAAARYYALTNAQEAFKAIADKAQQMGLGEDVDFVYALALLRASEESGVEGAMSLLQRVIEKDSEHVGAKYHLALLASKRGDTARATALVNEVLKMSPDHARAQALKAKLEPKVEKPAEPVALPAAPVAESFNDLLNKANGARQRERIKQAVDLYERALVLRADNAEALAGLGFCYLDLEKTGDAITQFQKAISSNSRYSDAHMGLAEAYRARGQKRDAVKHYQRYLELAPNGAEAGVARQALKDLGQD